MTVDFRCENCGKLLSVEGEAGSAVKCPHCGKKAVIPAGVASMPRPHVPPGGNGANGAYRANGAAAAAQPPDEPSAVESVAVIGIMAVIMPWVISVFFHLGLALITAFLTMIAQQARIPTNVLVPDAAWSDDPGGVVNPQQQQTEQKQQSDRREYVKKEQVTDAGLTKKRVPIAVAGGSAGSESLGLRAASGGPPAGFFGSGGNAHHVVYVIDRSGSMLSDIDTLKMEMLDSIGKLRPMQDFHVIFFASGTPTENPPRQLVPATEDYKAEAAKYLREVQTENSTNPIPALRRAFEVLDRADPRKPGKLIYLLTDGVFPDNDKVLAVLKELNGKKEVHVNTYLFGSKSPLAVEVLEKIAKENGGKFKYIDVEQ